MKIVRKTGKFTDGIFFFMIVVALAMTLQLILIALLTVPAVWNCGFCRMVITLFYQPVAEWIADLMFGEVQFGNVPAGMLAIGLVILLYSSVLGGIGLSWRRTYRHIKCINKH